MKLSLTEEASTPSYEESSLLRSIASSFGRLS